MVPDDFLDKAAKTLGRFEESIFRYDLSNYYKEQPIISPIEQILNTAITLVQKTNLIPDYLGSHPMTDTQSLGFSCSPQFQIGKYKVDFWVFNVSKEITKHVLVECDGHEFHDKNKEQRAYEKQRDRFIQSKGFKIFHYTGSEIVKDPIGIAAEIISSVTDDDKKDLIKSAKEYWI